MKEITSNLEDNQRSECNTCTTTSSAQLKKYSVFSPPLPLTFTKVMTVKYDTIYMYSAEQIVYLQRILVLCSILKQVATIGL